MGCGSSSPQAAPASVSYPRQQYKQGGGGAGAGGRGTGAGGAGGRGIGETNRTNLYKDADPLNKKTLYNDADPTDDIPPETVLVQGNISTLQCRMAK